MGDTWNATNALLLWKESKARLLKKTLDRELSVAKKPIKEGAKELFEEGNVFSKTGKTNPAGKNAGKAAGTAAAKLGKTAPMLAKKELKESVLEKFSSDVEMKAKVETARNQSIGPKLTKREKQLEQFKRVAADNVHTLNDVLAFGLEKQQAATVEQLLGQFFGQKIKVAGTESMKQAQKSANKLITGMKGHWDTALPEGQSKAELLKSVFDKLKAAQKKNPELNPSRFIRKELFDPWRKRFMKRLGTDSALMGELRTAAGIEIVAESDVPRFSLKLKVGSREVELGFDVDHAETRLSDAVRSAKRPSALVSVIDSEGMQLLTPRENRVQIEALRKNVRDYFEKADETTLAYFKRKGVTKAELEADIESVIAALEKPEAL